MLQAEATRDVLVESPYNETQDPRRAVPMYTRLFRAECNLPEALQLVYERNPDASNLSVGSFGCSIGAEADTILAHHRNSGLDIDVSVQGYDIQEKAIRIARAGRYFLPRKPSAEGILALDLEFLNSQGFDTDLEPVQRAFNPSRQNGFYQVDASPVREGFDVRFTKLESDGGGLEGKHDLILANNILYHLIPGVATRITRDLAAALNEQGVLSVGDIVRPSELDRPMGLKRVDSKVRFGEWLTGVTKILDVEFGLQPVTFGLLDQPVAFARP